MFIRLFSDLHNEFTKYDLPALDTDFNDVLVLAGDIGVAAKLHTFDPVKSWAKRFRQVIQIAGNHEYYDGSLLRAKDKIREHMSDVPNWTLADEDTVRVGDVSFICATLWTDFNRGNPVAMMSIRSGLNDYNYIRTGVKDQPYMRKITPHNILDRHVLAKEFIFDSIATEKAAGQNTVVVSHHGPTTLSIHPRFGTDILNWAYVSDLSNEILDTQPLLWLHGHTHNSFNYLMGDTRIITNPRGYQYPNGPCENHEFNALLRIEV